MSRALWYALALAVLTLSQFNTQRGGYPLVSAILIVAGVRFLTWTWEE